MRRFVCLVLFGALATAAMAAPATASPNLSIDHNPPAHLRPAAAVGIVGAGASTAPETDSPNISTAAAARALGVVGVAATDKYDRASNHGVGGNVARHNFDGLMINEQGWRTEAPRWLRATLALTYSPLLLYLNFALRNELQPAW